MESAGLDHNRKGMDGFKSVPFVRPADIYRRMREERRNKPQRLRDNSEISSHHPQTAVPSEATIHPHLVQEVSPNGLNRLHIGALSADVENEHNGPRLPLKHKKSEQHIRVLPEIRPLSSFDILFLADKECAAAPRSPMMEHRTKANFFEPHDLYREYRPDDVPGRTMSDSSKTDSPASPSHSTFCSSSSGNRTVVAPGISADVLSREDEKKGWSSRRYSWESSSSGDSAILYEEWGQFQVREFQPGGGQDGDPAASPYDSAAQSKQHPREEETAGNSSPTDPSCRDAAIPGEKTAQPLGWFFDDMLRIKSSQDRIRALDRTKYRHSTVGAEQLSSYKLGGGKVKLSVVLALRDLCSSDARIFFFFFFFFFYWTSG